MTSKQPDDRPKAVLDLNSKITRGSTKDLMENSDYLLLSYIYR